MKQKNKSNSDVWLILLGIALIVLIILCFFYKNEKLTKYKCDLGDRINEKEKIVSYLIIELEKLKNMKSKLIEDAIKFYKLVKCLSVFILLVLGTSIFLLTQANLIESVMVIITCISTIYYTVHIVVKNSVGNFDETLAVLQNYFIERQYRKHGFEPMLIEVFENRLENERRELNELRVQQHNNILKWN